MRNTIPFLLALAFQLFALNIVFSQGKEITLYPSLNGIYPFNSSAVISTLTVPQGLAVVLCNQTTQTIALTCATNADCNDGIACTTDICNMGVCQNTPNNAVCSDGQFCNGAEICIPSLGCVVGTPPCTECQTCNEGLDQCDNLPNGTSCSGGGTCQNGVCQALPIELVSFDCKVFDSKTHLTWRTASETQNAHFLVQHSTDGRSFQDLTKIPGAGNSQVENHYEYLHQNPSHGTNYYRLKQVDFDGGFEYSQVVSVEMAGGSPRLTIFPNPSDGNFSFRLQGAETQPLTALLTDLWGRTVWKFFIEEGAEKIPCKANLPKGIYLLCVESGNVVWRQQVVVH